MERKLNRFSASLYECALFVGCDATKMEDNLQDARIRYVRIKAGEYLMRRREKPHFLGILLQGNAVVERKTEDGNMLMSTLHAKDLFGAASIYCGDRNYVVDIRCQTVCQAICIPEDVLTEWLTNDPQMLRNYLQYLNERIRFLNRRLDVLSKSNVPSALMTYFASEAKNGVIRIKSYTALAETLCLSRPTMYRALDTLVTEEKIRREGKTISLLEDKHI